MKTYRVVYKPTGELVLDAAAREREARMRQLRAEWRHREHAARFLDSRYRWVNAAGVEVHP